MDIERLKRLALAAGFEGYKISNLSGKSQLDEAVSVGEYPCGEALNKFAELLCKEDPHFTVQEGELITVQEGEIIKIKLKR